MLLAPNSPPVSFAGVEKNFEIRGEPVDWLNEGPKPRKGEADSGQCLHDERLGYTPCGLCGRLLNSTTTSPASGRSDPFGHAQSCPRKGQPPNRAAISTTRSAETLRLIVPIPNIDPDDLESKEGAEAWGRSLGEALFAGIRHVYMIDEGELVFDLEGPWRKSLDGIESSFVSITFTDPTVGGSGYLQRVASELAVVAKHALEHLNHPDCETACYRCLKSYRNQRRHKLLQWPLVIPALDVLCEAPPVESPSGFQYDPKPWLEAFAEGVGSPLELKFWRLFQQHGFAPAKQVPIRLAAGQPTISVADFGVESARLAIYIDGASVHVGHRLRRDRFIRQRMGGAVPPWRVIALRAADLSRGNGLVQELIVLAKP